MSRLSLIVFHQLTLSLEMNISHCCSTIANHIMVEARRAQGRPRRPRGAEVSPSRRPSGSFQASSTHPSHLGPRSESRRTPEPQIRHDTLEIPSMNLIRAAKEIAQLHATKFDEFRHQKRHKNRAKEPLPSSTTTHRHCPLEN